MTERSNEPRRSSPEARDVPVDDRIHPSVGWSEIDEGPDTEPEDGQLPSPDDEIRLRAYYRYLEREGGDDDEIADWLAAESELSQSDAGRAAERRAERP